MQQQKPKRRISQSQLDQQVPGQLVSIQSMSHKHLRICPEKLQTEFQCTVCLNPINDCYITRCGHVYCKVCIEETINRHHRCPYCNEQLKTFKDDVFKNYHFNTIKKIVEDEIRKQNETYLKKVFVLNNGKKGNKQQQINYDKQKQQEEAILMAPVQKQAQEKKLLYGGNPSEILTHKQLVNQLQSQILPTIPAPIISPELITLPTTLQLALVPGKKAHKSVIKLSPLSTFSAIIPYLESICSQLNLQISLPIPKNITINSVQRAFSDRVGSLAGKTLKVENIPIKLNIYCYTNQWQQGKMTNFFNCKSCKVKWICQNCSILCHQGHETVLHIKQHKPDWACCYCVTKCDCKAINKSSKIVSK